MPKISSRPLNAPPISRTRLLLELFTGVLRPHLKEWLEHDGSITMLYSYQCILCQLVFLYATKVEAVAASYLNVGGSCCFLM
jgi:hypothetical protein